MSKKVGDTITVIMKGKENKLTVSGIYSDITNGGKTAKAVFTDHSENIMWSVICAKLSDKTLVDETISKYADRFTFAKISNIDEFVKQTFGSTIKSVEKASFAAISIALVITILVTLLFMKMLVAKDRYSIAIMKALGFTNSDITVQYGSRAFFVSMIGIIAGTLLANTLGEMLAGAVISSFGATSFSFSINPLTAYVLCPLLMICSVLITTIIGTSGVGKIKISENIKE